MQIKPIQQGHRRGMLNSRESFFCDARKTCYGLFYTELKHWPNSCLREFYRLKNLSNYGHSRSNSWVCVISATYKDFLLQNFIFCRTLKQRSSRVFVFTLLTPGYTDLPMATSSALIRCKKLENGLEKATVTKSHKFKNSSEFNHVNVHFSSVLSSLTNESKTTRPTHCSVLKVHQITNF